MTLVAIPTEYLEAVKNKAREQVANNTTWTDEVRQEMIEFVEEYYAYCEEVGLGLYLASLNFNHAIEDLIVCDYGLDPVWVMMYKYPNDVDARFKELDLQQLSADMEAGLLCENYGVVDSVEQFAERFGAQLDNDERDFIVTFTPMVKADQPSQGGWRWHKWGTYYGTKEPCHEYLYDEGPEIEQVFCFHVYEVNINR